MVYQYKRTTDRQNWEEENMANAIQSVMCHEMGYKIASEAYGIARSTLVRRVKLFREQRDMELACMKGLGRFSPIFGPLEEQELVNYLKKQESRLHGLTGKELRILVFQLAALNRLDHQFAKGMAGEDWLKNFFARNPGLSFRRPEPTSTARAAGFNQVVVSNFFDLWEGLLAEFKFGPERIFNVDEMGISTVPKHVGKIIATKGTRQVGKVTSGERGQLITVEVCNNADGGCLPPLFVFPRKRNDPKLLQGLVIDGCWSLASGNGWMRAEHFLKWMEWFIKTVEPSEKDPVALILDGSRIHSFNEEALVLARQNHVHILCLPPHSTHRLQPLDVSLMCPISTYYSAEVFRWQREHPGRNLQIHEVPELYSKALVDAAKENSITNGFRKTGIWPSDRHVFREEDFAPAEVTNRRLPVPIVPPDKEQPEEEAAPAGHEGHMETLDRGLSAVSISNIDLDAEREHNCQQSFIIGDPENRQSSSLSSNSFEVHQVEAVIEAEPQSYRISEPEETPTDTETAASGYSSDFLGFAREIQEAQPLLHDVSPPRPPTASECSSNFLGFPRETPEAQPVVQDVSPPRPSFIERLLNALAHYSWSLIGRTPKPTSQNVGSRPPPPPSPSPSPSSSPSLSLSSSPPPSPPPSGRHLPLSNPHGWVFSDRKLVSPSHSDSMDTDDIDFSRGPLFYPLSSDTDTSYCHREGSTVPSTSRLTQNRSPIVRRSNRFKTFANAPNYREDTDQDQYAKEEDKEEPSTSN